MLRQCTLAYYRFNLTAFPYSLPSRLFTSFSSLHFLVVSPLRCRLSLSLRRNLLAPGLPQLLFALFTNCSAKFILSQPKWRKSTLGQGNAEVLPRPPPLCTPAPHLSHTICIAFSVFWICWLQFQRVFSFVCIFTASFAFVGAFKVSRRRRQTLLGEQTRDVTKLSRYCCCYLLSTPFL